VGKLHIFIDESGDLGRKGSKYFVLAAVVSENPQELAAIIKRAKKYRMKKKFRKLPEFKANYSDRPTRERILRGLCKTSSKIYALVIEKAQMHEGLWGAKERFFNFLCGVLLRIIAKNTPDVVIVFDRRTGNHAMLEDINAYVARKIHEINCKINVVISHELSHESAPLQVADFACWAVHRKYEAGDNSYYSIIAPLIVNADREKMWAREN